MLDSRPGEEEDWKTKFDKNVSIFGDRNKDFVRKDDQGSPSLNRTKDMNMTVQKNLTKMLKLKQLNFVSLFLP
jgi:ABC-type phosphate/phosphonate transport system permease subunit